MACAFSPDEATGRVSAGVYRRRHRKRSAAHSWEILMQPAFRQRPCGWEGTVRVVTFKVDGVSKPVDVDRVVIAGWTGRNRAAVERHVAELAAMGVRSPAVTPSFFQVGTELLTTAPQIDVIGNHSSGEVEFVLVSAADGLYVGGGSDHTDRQVEAYDFTVAKQMCPKPMAAELWSLAAVEGHWDELVLRSHVTRRGDTILYQHGSVSNILSPMDLVARWPGASAGL